MTPERHAEFIALADRCILATRSMTPSPRREPTAMLGDNTRRTGTGSNVGSVVARWNQAIEVAMVQCRGNRKRATAMVVKQQPQLREALVAEANGGRMAKSVASSTATSAASTVRKSPTAQFREEVQRLIDGGMEKMAAVKLLSQRMGLSSNEPSPGFVSTRQQYR